MTRLSNPRASGATSCPPHGTGLTGDDSGRDPYTRFHRVVSPLVTTVFDQTSVREASVRSLD